MLQQHVQPGGRVAGDALDREQQIGLAVAQLLVDERGVLDDEAGPLQFGGKRLGQIGAQEADRLRGVAEHGAKQLVVRPVHLGGHRKGKRTIRR